MNPTQGIFAEATDLYQKNFVHFATIAFVVYLVVAVLQAIFTAALGLIGFLLATILGMAALFWVYGALVEAVSDVMDGRTDLSVGETFNKARPKIGQVAAAGILSGLAIGIGLLLFIVPGVILMTIWCLIVPAIVLENRGVFDSFSRSQQLVSGYGGNVFVVGLISVLLYFVFSIVLGLVLTPLPDGLASFLGSIVAGTLVAPFVATLLTLLYFRLRHAKEGGTAAPPGPGAAPPPANV
jgi:hypothetical protein